MNRETMTKVFSTTLSLALAVATTPLPAGAVGPMGPAVPAFVAGLTPPSPWMGSRKIAAHSSGGTVVLKTLSSMKRAQSMAYCLASVPAGRR